MGTKPLGPLGSQLYDEDFLVWTQETARLLRAQRLHQIDVEHVAEEIEGHGLKPEARTVESPEDDHSPSVENYSSAGVTATWTGATCTSATNPSGTFDLGFGYGRRLAGGGLGGKWTPHMNLVYEKSTGLERSVSLFEGVEFQMTDRLALDVSGQHFGVAGGVPDHQIVVGLTLNLGKPSCGGK